MCAARPTDGALLGALLRSASFQGEHLRTVGPVARLLCTHTHRVMSRRYLRAHDIECRRPSFSVGRLDANAPHQVPPAHPYHTRLPLPVVSFQDATTDDKSISRPPHLLRSLDGRHTTRSPRGRTGPPPRPHARPPERHHMPLIDFDSIYALSIHQLSWEHQFVWALTSPL